jgi:small redox-active disulfide protein 2
LKVQILGTGCAKCKKLAENAQAAIEASGVEDAQLVKVEELQEIMEFGVMSTPALAIDGDVKAAGKVLSVQEIQTMLEGE